MKKLMFFALIACLALLVSGSIFAVAGPAYTYEGEGALTASDNPANVGATATLKAYVTPYAKVTFGSQLNKISTGVFEVATSQGLIFTGKPDETQTGRIVYTLETNCDVNVDGFGYAFVGNTYGDVLKTEYQLFPHNDNYTANDGYDQYIWRTIDAATGYAWAPEAFDQKYVKDSSTNYNVNFRATTGQNISSQRAGNYTAKYIVTVWAPQNLN